MNTVFNNASLSKIKEAYEIQDVLIGTINYVGKAYLIVKVLGYPCVMPKNELEIFYIKDYNIYSNRDIVVKVISIEENQTGGFQIKVSHRAVVEEILEQNCVTGFETVKKNILYKGIVKDIREVGVFITLGKVEGLVPKSHLPQGFYETPENYFQIGSVVDVNVIFIDEEKRHVAFSIPSIDPLHQEKSGKEIMPFDRFRQSLRPNETILKGRVVYIEWDCVTLHVFHDNNKYTVYIKKENLAWEKVQNAADVVFLGEELNIKYLCYEDGKLYFDLKWQQKDFYPQELFSLDTEELLASLNVYENKFVGKLSLIKHKNKNTGEFEVKGGLASFLMSVSESEKSNLLNDPYTGTNIIAFVPVKYTYSLEDGKYYLFSLNVAATEKRIDEHRPYMFTAVLENAQEIPDPYKEQVEKSFKENKTPKSNRESASYLKEIGADMYTDRDRMFYELLQNADDASSVRGVKVMVQVMQDYLIFTHDGLSFSRQDFRSIVSTANSTKRLDRKKTGYKGIGFKSVFTDSEKVYIKTGGFFFVFDKGADLFNNFRSFYKYVNPLYNEEQLKVFFDENAEYEEEFENVDHLPWQLLPFWVNECPEELRGTTFMRNCNVAIALKLDSTADKYRELIKGIIQKPRFMLFLRNTQRIQFEDKKWEILSIAKQIDLLTDVVRLKNSFANTEEEVSYIVKEGSEICVNNDTFKADEIPMVKECTEVASREKWKIYQVIDGIKIPITSIPERIIAADTSTLSYAFMLNDNGEAMPIPDKTPSLYAFLPMEDRRYLFPFFINADFELSSNRQEAKRVSVWNEFLFYNIGKNIVSWVATLANGSHPSYLNLLPQELFTEELEEGKIDNLAAQFNRGYKKALQTTSFIRNDRGEVVTQNNVAVDDSGFAKVIGTEEFCSLFKLSKRLVSADLNIESLANTTLFSSIEHLQSSDIVSKILDKSNRYCILRYWCQVEVSDRIRILNHIISLPKNRKNLFEYIKDIPAYSSGKRLFSFNKLLKSNSYLLRLKEMDNIHPILLKLGFKLIDGYESDHPFHEELSEDIQAYKIHIFNAVSQITAIKNVRLTASEKCTLFMHFSNVKYGLNQEQLADWKMFLNQDGVVVPLHDLTHIDSKLYSGITSAFVINEEELNTAPKLIGHYLMKEKNQFDEIVVTHWSDLVGKVGSSEELALSLYRLASNTYLMAEHEQAIEKNRLRLLEIPFVFVNEQMQLSSNVIVSDKFSANDKIKLVVEHLTDKYIPSLIVTQAISINPFNFKNIDFEHLTIVDDKKLSKDQLDVLLSYCLQNDDTIFAKYYIESIDDSYILKPLSKGTFVGFTNDISLRTFIESNCPNIKLLDTRLSKYCSVRNILTEDELLLFVLDDISEIDKKLTDLLPICKDAISSVKRKFIENIPSIILYDNYVNDKNSQSIQILKIAYTIEKIDETLYNAIRDKIFIVVANVTTKLSDIKLQHTIEIETVKYPLSKLLPNEDELARVVDTIKEYIIDNTSQSFADNLFGDKVEIDRAASIFSELNKPGVVLANGAQLAFVLHYASTVKLVDGVYCKVHDNASTPVAQLLYKYWLIHGQAFIDDMYVLNSKYEDVGRYLNLPYIDEKNCSIIESAVDFQYIKSVLTDDETHYLLDYLFEHSNVTSFSSTDLAKIRRCLNLSNENYVISPCYTLDEEKIPTIVEQWILCSKTVEKTQFLLNGFGIHGENSDVVSVRKYLDKSLDLVNLTSNQTLSRLTCNWLANKNLLLTDVQYALLQDLLLDTDYETKIDFSVLENEVASKRPYLEFGDYSLYLYSSQIPWISVIKDSNYTFHKFVEGDIAIKGYSIYANENCEPELKDLIKSIINTEGFSADDFVKFLDAYQALLSGTLDGENDEDPDEDERNTANEIARQEALSWLSARGYDISCSSSNYSIIQGVKKGSKNYHIVVKSFRSKKRELKINPNEWLELLNVNARLMLYLGHMSFAVIDRQMLLGNHDFLRLRISSSNFSIDNGKLDYTIRQLAENIRMFERTHFVFEHVNESILTRADSLDGYGLYNSNFEEEFSAGSEDDL